MNEFGSPTVQPPHAAPTTPLLQVRDLKAHFTGRTTGLWGREATIKAVNGVSFVLNYGETLGLVGETGCGKTTLGRTILRLIPRTSGQVYFEGIDLYELNQSELRAMRREMQIIFQDPLASLNPRMTVGDIIVEPLRIHRVARGKKLRDRVVETAQQVGLSPEDLPRYPHTLSGGQRQRVGIARALALRPKLIVCDEPVSALDVSIQSQILNLLTDLKEALKLSYLFIAHNLAVVRHISDRIAVMYLGRIVETAPTSRIYLHPKHPYTQALLASVPEPDPAKPASKVILKGEPASPAHPPTGCAFHPRCPFTTDRCKTTVPPLRILENGPSVHWVACHHADRPLTLENPESP